MVPSIASIGSAACSIPIAEKPRDRVFGQHAFVIYDPVLDQWTSGTPLPSPRRAAGGAELNGTFYVVGGYHGSGSLSDVLAYGIPCYANCDGSTVPPILTANDFQCFLIKYAQGCNY
jgi:hypothetical protein